MLTALSNTIREGGIHPKGSEKDEHGFNHSYAGVGGIDLCCVVVVWCAARWGHTAGKYSRGYNGILEQIRERHPSPRSCHLPCSLMTVTHAAVFSLTSLGEHVTHDT